MNQIARVTTPAEGFGEVLTQMLTDPKIPADKLQIMLTMQRELIAERRREAYQSAFVAMSAQMPQVPKNGIVVLTRADGQRKGSYDFALWEDMDACIRPILIEHGFALSFCNIPAPPGFVTTVGKLMHRDGHFETTQKTLPVDLGPGRNNLQGDGSATTYGMRYCTQTLCNIVRRGQDDDGTSARSLDLPLTAEQCATLEELLKTSDTDRARFLAEHANVNDVSEIMQRDFVRYCNALNARQRRLEREGAAS